MSKPKGKATQSIHGTREDKEYHSVAYPVFQTTTFAVENSDEYYRYIEGEPEFYIYTRSHNPTIRNVEEKLAQLENAEDCYIFGSGMAAITSAILSVVQSGDKVVASTQLYGTTYKFLRDIAPKFGIETIFLPEEELYQLDKHIPDATLVYFESPINPTCRCVDIAKVVQAAGQINATTIMDNTFASPYNQNPIDFGVDIVVHSATKYLGGHSDVMGGAVMGSAEKLQKVVYNRTMFGGIISPHSASQLDRSLKTFHIRMNQHNQNAQQLAEFFVDQPTIEKTYYPGLPNSDDYELASRQMCHYGAMMCIDVGSLEWAKQICDSLQVGLNATSLGGVETLVSIPVLTSHINMSDAELARAGVAKGMIRISVGLENIEDLIADFEQALA